MRRKVIALVALACLVSAGSAYATTAFNHYSASFKFTGAAGSVHRPAKAGFTLHYTAANTTKGDRAYPLIDIKQTIAGIRTNYRYFPTCTAKRISASPTFNKVCPRGSLVAAGTVMAMLGSPNAASTGVPCHLILDVYNAGHGRLTYFFVVPDNGAACNGLPTGTAAPYVSTTREVHGNLFEDTPLPPDVSTNAGNIGMWGSLEKETLTFKKMTRTVRIHGHRRAVPFVESTGCKHGKRAWSVTFTATNGKVKQHRTVSGKSAC